MNELDSNASAVQDHKLCFAFIGHSGTGKSTLIQHCLAEQNWPNSRKPRLLQKCTTRALRSPEEAVELTTLERSVFLERQAAGSLLMAFENHGELYGMERSEIELQGSHEFGLVSLNTEAAIAIKAATALKVYICLVEAERDIRFQRLLARGDSGTLEQLESRLEHQENPLRRTIADFVLTANGTIEEAFQDIRRYIESILHTPNPSHG